tara:strand:- start:756 stop:992 length:237 start_codon:yes stop_codon:yes gene_type:complete
VTFIGTNMVFLTFNHTVVLKKKKPLIIQGSFAPVPGLEPGTHGLTVRCSNQLSYTGIKLVNEYTTLFKNEKSNFIFFI